MSSILDNLERVREQIAQAAAKAGRDIKDVELVAITKTHPAEKVREAVEAGQTLFGESRVQEARAKIPELSSNIRWHFVGHLQKNKVRQALPLFEIIHSVDSLALAQDINRIAEEEGLYPRVLLEVNVAGEGSKFGFAPDDLREQMEALLALPRLSIEGLMCIPPLAVESEDSQKFFVQVRELRDSRTCTKNFCESSDSTASGGIHISPSIDRRGSASSASICSRKSSGANPNLLPSPATFTSSKTRGYNPSSSAIRLMSCASARESTL